MPEPVGKRVLFGGKIVVGKQLGMGGRGSRVFRAEHASFGACVLKVIPKSTLKIEQERVRKYFEDEVFCGEKLVNRHIRKMFEWGEADSLPELTHDDGVFYLVLEYLPYTLAEILQEGPLHPTQVLDLISAVGEALSAAHGESPPIVHRDLKPQNILLSRSTDLGSAKLADFGIARTEGGTRVTSMGSWAGTDRYMAPEQFIDSSRVTPAADLYSLALLAWECLAGEVPLASRNWQETMELRRQGELPTLERDGRRYRALEQILRKALRPKPQERQPSVAAFIAEFFDAGVEDKCWLQAQSLTPDSVPVDVGHDERAKGGCLWINLPESEADLLSRATPEIDWRYSKKRQAWWTRDAEVDFRHFQLLVDRARELRDKSEFETKEFEGGNFKESGREGDDFETVDERLRAEIARLRATDLRQLGPAFVRLMQPDAALGAVVGNTPMPRSEVTKKLWQYIKRNGRQDQQERRMIKADDKLRVIFGGKDKVSIFEMTKLVNKHLKKLD